MWTAFGWVTGLVVAIVIVVVAREVRLSARRRQAHQRQRIREASWYAGDRRRLP
jgi:hypothetical protein